MSVEHLYLSYPLAAAMGLLHGSDPGHGWPLAAAYGVRAGSRLRALAYTLILALGHFTSTLAVVTVVWLLGRVAEAYLAYLQLAAGLLLVALGLYELSRALTGRGHGHGAEEASVAPSPWSMFKYALLLGFAHEEEVALSAIVLLGVNPLALSLVYGGSVLVSMTAWTYITVTLARRLSSEKFERALDLASPLFLVAVGAYVVASALAEA